MNQALVTIENDTPLADSRIMAEKLEIQHHNLLATITKYLSKIERKLGVVLFRTDKPLPGSTGGRPEKYALLTEGQAYFVVTLCENTDFAIDLREELVIKFLAAKQEISELRQQLQNPLQGLSSLDYLDQVIEKQREILRGYHKIKRHEQRRLGIITPYKPRIETPPQKLLLDFLRVQPVPVTIREITQYAPSPVRRLKAGGVRVLLIEMETNNLVTVERQGKAIGYRLVQ